LFDLVVRIPRAKNIKLKSKVGMAIEVQFFIDGKQSSRVLRPN